MLQQSSNKTNDSEIVVFLGTCFGTSDIRTIFLKAGRKYIENISRFEEKGKSGSLEEGVGPYIRNYKAGGVVPFYLRVVYKKLLKTPLEKVDVSIHSSVSTHMCQGIVIDQSKNCITLSSGEEVYYEQEEIIKDLCDLIKIDYVKIDMDTLEPLIGLAYGQNKMHLYCAKGISQLALWWCELPGCIIALWYEEIYLKQKTTS